MKKVKARFYIKGKGVGYRPFIMKEMLKRGIERGMADNYKDMVEIRAQGMEEKIKDLHRFLKTNVPIGAKVEEVTEIEYLNDMDIPRASEYSQALTFEQMGKGIPILSALKNGQEKLLNGQERLIDGQKSLPKDIAKELKKILK
jgi:acylphosphatase